jgi:hypothetical protein
VKRIGLFSALAVSLLVPGGAMALLLGAVVTTPSPAAGSSYAASFDKVELYESYKELARLDAQAQAATPGTIAELRRISREAKAWADKFDTDAVWEEFAQAISGYAGLLADALTKPRSITRAQFDAAVDRINAAHDALPDEIPLQ